MLVAMAMATKVKLYYGHGGYGGYGGYGRYGGYGYPYGGNFLFVYLAGNNY